MKRLILTAFAVFLALAIPSDAAIFYATYDTNTEYSTTGGAFDNNTLGVDGNFNTAARATSVGNSYLRENITISVKDYLNYTLVLKVNGTGNKAIYCENTTGDFITLNSSILSETKNITLPLQCVKTKVRIETLVPQNNYIFEASVDAYYNDTFNAVQFYAYNENTMAALPFNVTLANETNTTTYYNMTNGALIYKSGLPSGVSTAAFESDGYISRSAILTISGNSTQNATIYLLADGGGIYHSIYVSTAAGTPLEGATVSVSMLVGSYYITLSSLETDTTGLALNYLGTTKSYRFAVTKTGYGSETFNAIPNPVNPIIYVRLGSVSGEADYVNASTIFSNISYSFLPASWYQNVTFNASFSLTDPDNKITYQKFNATYPNGSLLCNVAVTTEPGGTTEICTIPAVFGTYCVQGMMARTGFDNYTFDAICYQVYNSTAGLGGLEDDLETSISDTGYLVLALIVTMIVCSGLAYFGAGMLTAYVAVGMFAFFAALKPAAMIGIGALSIPFWAIVGLMAMCAVGLTILRSYI
jgi:hypothetical protein